MRGIEKKELRRLNNRTNIAMLEENVTCYIWIAMTLVLTNTFPADKGAKGGNTICFPSSLK